MTSGLLVVVAGYLALVAAVAAAAMLGVRCAPALRTGIVVAQVLLVIQAAVDTVTLLRGHRPADPATHLGYLVTSVALLPLLTARPGATREPPASASRSTAAVAALACAATAVVVVRLHATWAAAA